MGVVLRKRAGVVRVRGRRVEREMSLNDMFVDYEKRLVKSL
jgi:hypothetical protein